MIRFLAFFCVSLVLLTLPFEAHAVDKEAAAKEQQNMMIVLDASGSMWGQVKGKAKMDIAKEVIEDLVKNWNLDVGLGLVGYGHRQKTCRRKKR